MSDARALPPRRLAAQQARVLTASLQIHPVHALHGGSGRPSGIPLLHLHRAALPPYRALCGAGPRDVLRNGVPRRTVAHRSRADKDHKCRWVRKGGGEDFVGVVAGPVGNRSSGRAGNRTDTSRTEENRMMYYYPEM